MPLEIIKTGILILETLANANYFYFCFFIDFGRSRIFFFLHNLLQKSANVKFFINFFTCKTMLYKLVLLVL